MRKKVSKYDPEFMDALRKFSILDKATGNLRFNGMYASTHISIAWKGNIVSVPHSHVVWFLTHDRWPTEGMTIDHRDDDAMHNAPDNLQELTHIENQRKRRGRIVYRSYGKGKYGYGFNLHCDGRDGKWYVTRYLSRGHGNGDLKNIKKGLGGYLSEKEAEKAINEFIEQIKIHGLDWMPTVEKKRNRLSVALEKRTPEIRSLRENGMTYAQISEKTGFSEASLWKVCKQVNME
jgi:hypothetical protein